MGSIVPRRFAVFPLSPLCFGGTRVLCSLQRPENHDQILSTWGMRMTSSFQGGWRPRCPLISAIEASGPTESYRLQAPGTSMHDRDKRMDVSFQTYTAAPVFPTSAADLVSTFDSSRADTNTYRDLPVGPAGQRAAGAPQIFSYSKRRPLFPRSQAMQLGQSKYRADDLRFTLLATRWARPPRCLIRHKGCVDVSIFALLLELFSPFVVLDIWDCRVGDV